MAGPENSYIQQMAAAVRADTAERAQQSRMADNVAGLGACATAGYTDKLAVPSLRDRISEQRRHAGWQVRRAEVLAELEFLLDKHPEIARMLDLLEQIK